MTNYIEERLKALMPDGLPPVQVSASATEDDVWGKEGGADVCVRLEDPWLWYVIGILRGPYYYLRDHGAMVPEVTLHVSEPDLFSDGEHGGYQRCGNVVYYRGDDVEDLVRNTLKRLERRGRDDDGAS